MDRMSKGILIAGAAATLIASGAVAARATDKAAGEPVRCAGINACKGQGACDGADHACKGANACKGQGWIEVKSADECAKKGGKVVEPK
jgi:hypothetical protein